MNWLASQPLEAQQKFLKSLPKGSAKRLMHQWRGWKARPSQLAPEGNWRVWLILAGRGFGKTRSGAEWVREQAESGRARRIALVAENAAEARQVMVEGESGDELCAGCLSIEEERNKIVHSKWRRNFEKPGMQRSKFTARVKHGLKETNETWHLGHFVSVWVHCGYLEHEEMLRAMRAFLRENDMMAYLSMMAVRLLELRRVLKPTGTLYLHCDSTASHYLKIVMDSVFGPDRFLNEIIWKRTSAHGDASRRFAGVHDTILVYAKQKIQLGTSFLHHTAKNILKSISFTKIRMVGCFAALI
jgi:hypothetical protein